MAEKYRSSSLDRSIQTYIKPREYMMFEAEREMLIRGGSEHARNIIETYYKSLTPAHQQQLLDHYQKKLIKKSKINP